MKARIIRIGNSSGVRLPKPLLAEAGLSREVEIVASNGAIVISSVRQVRRGWGAAAKQAHACGDDNLIDAPTSTRFDDEDWKW